MTELPQNQRASTHDKVSGGARALVTIVITVTERTELLLQAVASALSQTYSPVQVIVIDARQRSIPRSNRERTAFVELFQCLSGFADQVESYQQTNGGIVCARNLGLRRAGGEFVLFASGEQTLEPDTIERMMGAIGETNRPWVQGQCKSARSMLGDNASGSSAVVLLARNEALQARGGFDERDCQDNTGCDLAVGLEQPNTQEIVRSDAGGNTVGFVVLSNRNPEQVTRLLYRLGLMFDNPPIACHHDFGQSGLDTRGFPTSVRFVQDYIATRRADFTLVSATLAALRLLYGDGDGPDWFVLLSGADYPIKPASKIVEDLRASPYDALIHHELIQTTGCQRRPWQRECADRYLRFRTAVPHITRRGRLTTRKLHLPFAWCRPFVPFSNSLRCYAGSQWFAARRKCAQYILQAHSLHRRLSRHLSRCHVPDETYFQCILANEPTFRLSQDCKRYIDWTAGGNSPKLLGMEDLPALLASSAHFARKFDITQDSRVLEALDEIVRESCGNRSAKVAVRLLVP